MHTLFTLISYSTHVLQVAALLLAEERSVAHDVRVLSGHKLRAWSHILSLCKCNLREFYNGPFYERKLI